MNIKLLALPILLILVCVASAVPVAGAASSVGTNNFTVAVTGSDGGDVWIAWGQAVDADPWSSMIITGDGSIEVAGAPIIGGSTVYYHACDSTGCGNVQSVIIPSITPLPKTNFGDLYTNLTNNRFKITIIPVNLVKAYEQTQVPIMILAGVVFFFLFFGFWFRTRSVRLTLILGLLMAAFVVTPSAGLFLGAPLAFQLVAQGLMAAAIAGVVISFIRK